MGKVRRIRGEVTGNCEWLGARLPAPMHVVEGEPYRPDIILWLELPDGFIVGSELTHPDRPEISFGATLLAAMKKPMVGPPRRPLRIRVATESLADEVRTVVGDAVHVSIAPTPEIDAVVQEMAGGFPAGDEPESYFEGGRVSPEAVEELFRAAKLLFGIAPWKVATDDQVLRLDIPQLDVEGACVSIIGHLGESLGLLIFPSMEGYYAFVERSDELQSTREPIDLGTTLLSLNFERAADLPASMQREAAEHDWPVAAPDAYPRVLHQDRDGLHRPLSVRDFRIASACALSLTTFFLRHPRVFEDEFPEPVCESYADGNDLSVRFTAPYDAWPLFESNEPLPAKASGPRRVGRNEPCPCGSGKKYKKCHLGANEQSAIAEPASESIHEMDMRLVATMHRWAIQRFGRRWHAPIKKLVYEGHEANLQLLLPWSVFHKSVDGQPVVRWFQDEMGRRLSHKERGWLAAQRRAWLTVWEVSEVEPGVGLELRDLLSDEIRRVVEASGSKTLVKRDAVLGRVVDYEGSSVICGMHPRMLPPLQAAEYLRRIRSRLRRQTAGPPDGLRDEKLGRYMIRRWEEAVDSLDPQRSQLPRLSNTDGDPLLLTIDHFEFDSNARCEVEAKLATIEGVQVPENTEDCGIFRIVRPGDSLHADLESTLVGVLRVTEGSLNLETNSVKRADELRARVEKVCQGQVRFQIREHCDPRSEKARADIPVQQPATDDHPAVQKALSELKARHYESWPDQPLPSLNGKTPQQAARTATGRSRLDVLLKDIENHESRMPSGEQFDFRLLRARLGLDP